MSIHFYCEMDTERSNNNRMGIGDLNHIQLLKILEILTI